MGARETLCRLSLKRPALEGQSRWPGSPGRKQPEGSPGGGGGGMLPGTVPKRWEELGYAGAVGQA